MQTETTKPLYKVLNEKRTQGEWEISGFVLFSPLKPDSVLLRVPYFQSGNPDKYILKPEAEANAQYTALAVNEFANGVELIERLMTVNPYCEAWVTLEKEVKEFIRRIS